VGVHRHDDVLEGTFSKQYDRENPHNRILTDGKMRAKSAAFARVLPHMHIIAEGNPSSNQAIFSVERGSMGKNRSSRTKGKVIHPSFL
jgi:hypothetical protein